MRRSKLLALPLAGLLFLAGGCGGDDPDDTETTVEDSDGTSDEADDGEGAEEEGADDGEGAMDGADEE